MNAPSLEIPVVPAQTSETRSYGLGIALVAGTVLVSVLLCSLLVGDRPRGLEGASPIPAGERLYLSPVPVGPFQFTERSGRKVTEDDLSGRPWIAAFVFTRCKATCPVLTSKMKSLQGKLAGTDTRLVSISVDPKHDTPRVLSEYAKSFRADPDRWWFLSGDRDKTYQLIHEKFLQGAREATAEEVASGSESILHSVRLALVDRQNRLDGLYDSTDPRAVGRLITRARALGNPLSTVLPTLNASLNATSALLLVIALVMVLRKHYRAHVVCMIAALTASSLFLAGYLGYHFLVAGGSTPFLGVGKPLRVFYFSVLLSHTLLASAVLPLVLLTVIRAARSRFQAHKSVARVTFPVWLYVSVTGVMVYFMLYQMDFSAYSASL